MSETTTVETSVLSYFGMEIGLFTIFAIFSSFFILKKIKGNVYNLEHFFAAKKWPFLKSDKSFMRYSTILKIIAAVLLIMPVVSLILWGIMVLVVQARYGISQVAGVSIFLVGFAVIFFALAVLYVKWSYFKIKIVSMIFASVALILYFAFQLYALLETTVPSFLGLSAVFLSINAIIMVLTASMSYSNSTGSILDIMDKLVPNTNKEDAVETRYNKLTVEEQFEKLLIDPDFEVTEKEIMRVVTIINSRKDFSRSVLSGGLNTVFRKRSVIFKRIVLLSLYLLSVGILVIYGVIINNRTPEKQLGYVTLVAVVTTDIITFFISQLNISNGQTTLTFLIVGMRCFLFGFGGTYWFLGYCSLYLLLGVVIGWKTVDRYFPLEIDYSKEKSVAPLYKRIIKEPLFTYGIINVVFIIVVIVVAAVTSLDIPRDVFLVLGQEFALWVFGVASILISLTGLAVMATFRLHQRRLKDIKDKFRFPLIKREFSTYLIFCYFTYLFAALCGVLWYVIGKDIFVLLTALIIPPVILAIYIFYLNFKRNDYRILADIKDQNIKAKAFLENQAKLKQTKTLNIAKTMHKEDVEAIELKEEAPKDDGVPEYLNFGGSAGQKKFIVNEDWRETTHFFKAFFTRKLLSSDYANILSALFITGALITYAVVIYAVTTEFRLRGFTVAVTLFVVTTIFLPMEGYFGTLNTPNVFQIILLALGVIGNYVYAGCVTANQFTTVKGDTAALVTIIYWVFFLPSLIMLAITVYSLKQRKGKPGRLSIALGVICFLHWIGLGVFFVLVDILAAAIVTWGFVILLLLGLGVYYIYAKNNKSLPRRVVQVATYGGILILSAVFIVSLCMDSFNDFVGFSLTYLAILLCGIIYVGKQLIADIVNKSSHPVFYSPWVFPIYKYDPTINGLKKNSTLGYMTFGVIFFFWLWTITVSIWVDPVSLGVSLGCLCEVVAAVYFMYMTSDTTQMLSEALKRDDLFPKTVKKAWLQARNTYMTSKNVTRVSDLLTFAEYEKEAQTLTGFINETKDRVRKQDNKQQVKPTDPENLKKVPEKSELQELYAKLNEKMTAVNAAFKDEVRLLIHFELLVMLGIEQAVTKEKMTILNFVTLKKADLEAKNLKFAFGPENISIEAKYKLVMDKYNRLSEEQQKSFDSLKAVYLDQIKNEKVEASEKMKAEEEAKKQREKALSEKLEQKKKLMQDMSSVPLKDMPDCLQKYERIVKEYGQGKKKYEDNAFPPTENSLGANLSSLVSKWERPTGLEVFGKTGIAVTDPRQGSIGDCYFVSALTVAGKDNIEKALLVDKVAQQKADVGAYIVRFYFMGEPVEIIVDDLFPKDGQGDWSFCRSDENNKLWPMIFEKAYAKLHGNYQKIVAGKVSYALSELTGGYPEEIKLSTAQKNIDAFWEKIMKYKENGYLLGAGTPENAMGDKAISSEGIIQGHAYAIIDMKEYDSDKLIKLRNPHGLGGAEWTGDWGDASIKWNEKAKKVLKPENKEDGIFWMSLNDFVYEFKCLYVCRIFDPKLWKTSPSVEGEWAGESAAGLPNKKNPSADLSKNPHYGIKVNRRCSVFIAVTQEDRIDMFRGKLPIMFMVQKNGGKRVTSTSLDILAGNSGAPTDLITVSAEVPLEVPTYPYTFTLMVANANSGPEGEGKFKIDIQCTDDFSIFEMK